MKGLFRIIIAILVCTCTSSASHLSEIDEAVSFLLQHRISACSMEEQGVSNSIPSCDLLSLQGHRLMGEEDETEEESVWKNILGVTLCVSFAALAAGLTLGLLGLDPLLLLIKERAAVDMKEREIAKQLLPLVQQHHRLLVTLLLMNAVANEALPIFLESLVPPSIAILVSVTLVLFFGEIIPSAIFTGPNQMQIAYHLSPLVKTAMFLLAPLAVPIAKLLDYVLHHDGEAHNSSNYNRGELSALIRIQYEERMAVKRRRKARKAAVLGEGDVVSASFRNSQLREDALRTTIRQLENHPTSLIGHSIRPGLHRSPSIHMDEVTMAEGALQMKTRVALDVFTPLRRVFALPDDCCLSEKNLVRIYASGYSRIPVYAPTDNPKNKTGILGILLIKQLIVVNPKDARPISTLPLYTPLCVSHAIPLLDLMNKMQTGGSAQKGGHMALVCARPSVASEALARGQALPEAAGLMGVITLEDVLEMLLQEQIYDETDRDERNAHRLVKLVIRRWKNYVARKKAGTLVEHPTREPALASVVKKAVVKEHGAADETTNLL